MIDGEGEGEPGARARWLGVVLILLALAALVWQAWVAGQADEPAAVRLAPLSKPSLSEMLASVDSAKLGMRAASAAEAAAASAPMAPDEVEVCGVGRVKADESGQPKNMEIIHLAAQRARERLLPTLLNSTDEVPRAAGLLLQSVSAFGAGDSPMPANVFARDSLANMAVATRSPQVYAWAMRACQGQRGQGMCQMLSAEQWARLDPGNAMVWLQVATDAQARGDAAAVAEAMYRVSHASTVDMRWGTFTSMALAKLPRDMSVLARGALLEELMGMEAGFLLPHLVASQHCSAADVRDANRQQTCAAVAEVFYAKGTTLVDVGISAAIGQRAGWPAERVSAVRDERDAIQQIYARQTAALSHSNWGCAALEQALRRLAEISQHGEMAVMRRALKGSPESTATLAQRFRESGKAASAPASAAER